MKRGLLKEQMKIHPSQSLTSCFILTYKNLQRQLLGYSYFLLLNVHPCARFSDPTWINHRDIFLKAGFTDVQPYTYLDYSSMTFNFHALLECMRRSKPRTVFILHAQAHNPSGLDPSQDQWRQICEVMKTGQLIPFFDCAYQGWASGDLDRDAWAVRHFCDQGVEMMVSQSFGKVRRRHDKQL